MARNRMLNPEFWLDEDLAKLSAYSRLLYQGLWGICDDNYATLPNRPEWIKAQIFPYESVNIKELLTELSASGRLVLFQENDKEFWYIKNFFKHQKVEKPSKPKYPKYEASLRIVGEESENTLSEVKRREVKRREEKLDEQKARPSSQGVEKKIERSDRQKVYDRICEHLEKALDMKITTWGKQLAAIKDMLDAGYTELQIIKTIDYMANKDEFYSDKGFDMTTVAKQISLYKAKMRKQVQT